MRRVLLLVLLLLAALAPVPAASAAPALVLSPASGPVGTTTTVSGTGFPGSTKGMVTVGTTRTSIRTSASGAFSVAVAVPAPSSGSTVAVRADAGRATATAWFTVTAPPPPPPPSGDVLGFGVSTPGGLHGDRELDAVASLVGESPSLVLAFSDLTRDPDVEGLRKVAARGAVPVVTLEPWVAGAGTVQPDYTLTRIADGAHDVRLRQWAAALDAHDGEVWLRFAHEMNGDWYPWSARANGGSPAEYVRAWRHVHGLFDAADNVRLVWAPNVPYPGSTPLAELWPGAEHVDVVGLDGYNWGTSQSWSSWQTPAQLFDQALAEVRAHGKPVVVTETASAERGGDKAAWNRALVAHLDADPAVRAFVWFHHDKETDWRIDSSRSSAAGLREALAARR